MVGLEADRMWKMMLRIFLPLRHFNLHILQLLCIGTETMSEVLWVKLYASTNVIVTHLIGVKLSLPSKRMGSEKLFLILFIFLTEMPLIFYSSCLPLKTIAKWILW